MKPPHRGVCDRSLVSNKTLHAGVGLGVMSANSGSSPHLSLRRVARIGRRDHPSKEVILMLRLCAQESKSIWRKFLASRSMNERTLAGKCSRCG